MSETEERPEVAEMAQPTLFGFPTDDYRDQHRVYVPREALHDLAHSLRQDGYQQCVDLCAVDYLSHSGRMLPVGVTPERFEVVVNLINHAKLGAGDSTGRVRLRVQVPEGDPVVHSLFDVWPGVDHMEREAFDLFGITFDGHPGLTRILLPDQWSGHPLRKDYAIGRIPVQFTAGGTER